MPATNFSPHKGSAYIALYKPYGVISQFTKPGETDKETLAVLGLPNGVYPIGRLDWDSEGLLLLSDDGRLNSALLHPDRGHRRVYYAQVENIPSQETLSKLESGVTIQGHRTAPAQARLLDSDPQLPARPVPIRFRKNIPTAWIELTLTEGKNRQVRKMTAAVGHPTLRLVRVRIGALSLEELTLQPGDWIHLSHKQVMDAFR